MQNPWSSISFFVYLQIDLMMSDRHPVKAMCDIRDLGLFYVVFSFPEKSNPPVFDKCDGYVLVLASQSFIFFIQATVCGVVIFQNTVAVELLNKKHHCSIFAVLESHLFISYGYTGSVFRILRQLGILHLILAALFSAINLTPSCRSGIFSIPLDK
jgi:hypothetical protein